eukprot:g2447.t1
MSFGPPRTTKLVFEGDVYKVKLKGAVPTEAELNKTAEKQKKAEERLLKADAIAKAEAQKAKSTKASSYFRIVRNQAPYGMDPLLKAKC